MNNELFGVQVIEALDKLLEQVLCIELFELPPLPHIAEKVTALAQLHDEAHVLVGFKAVVKTHYIRVAALLQNGYLLHNAPLLLFFISQHFFLDALDCH